jgi:replicative DNA helicase
LSQPKTEAPNIVPHAAGPGASTQLKAEQGLLGAIPLDNKALDRVSAFLEPAHFYDPVHGQVFNVARRVVQSGRLATPVTLKTYFEGRRYRARQRRAAHADRQLSRHARRHTGHTALTHEQALDELEQADRKAGLEIVAMH